MPSVRDTARARFLADLVTLTINNQGYGWFTVTDYTRSAENPETTYAIIWARAEGVHGARVDPDLMAAGLRVIRRAIVRLPDTPDASGNHPVLHHADTGQRLHLSGGRRCRILAARRENDAGQLEVADGLAILECALFGAVTFT